MISLVTINKGGVIKTENIKKVNIDELYKKAKLRKNDNFKKRNTWKTEDFWVSVYAKTDGRAGSENKYELPPPIDKELYFGIMVAIKHKNKIPKNEEVVKFTKEEWLKVYEKCMGGFEDLGDSSEEEEEEEIPAHLRTKSGYMKDGFVVDDDEEEDEDEDEDEGEDEHEHEDEDEHEHDEISGDESYVSDSETNNNEKKSKSNKNEENDDILEEIGSELSEEDYDYN